MKRVLTAAVAIPILVFILLYTPPYVAIALVVIAMLLALHEYFVLVELPMLFRIAGFFIAIAATLLHIWIELSFFLLIGTMLMLMVGLFSKLDLPAAFRATVYAFFGAAYVGGLMGFLAAIRLWPDGLIPGTHLLLMLFIIIWSGDSFAYFAGRSFGRHKLAPVVSPKKTWEGAIAGFGFSIIAAVLCKFTFLQALTTVDAIILGGLIGIIGQIGDLCESIVKRAANVKDSGGILPGHGGMLDRVDSLLFGAPAMYYYLSFLK
jgi:phosphatidate cytidylyltransferase